MIRQIFFPFSPIIWAQTPRPFLSALFGAFWAGALLEFAKQGFRFYL